MTGNSPFASMIRVDQAGEFGAKRIYAGQLAILGNRHPASRSIAHMAEQEARHLDAFDRIMAERGVRPTALRPFWEVAGFALGAATVAIETEIDNHYREQLREIGDSDTELAEMIEEFRQEEVEHRDTALAAGAEQAPAYPLISAAIRLGCRAAIALSKRI